MDDNNKALPDDSLELNDTELNNVAGGAGAGKVIKYPVGYMAYFKLGCNRSISCRGTRGPILETRINPTNGYAEYKVKCNFCGDESFYYDRLIQ